MTTFFFVDNFCECLFYLLILTIVVVGILALHYLRNNVSKCDWWDVGIVGRGIFVDGHTIIFNTTNRWYINDSFMLADHGQQVFYLANPKKGR